MILIIDFGSQTTHLISRRLADLGQTVKIIAPEKATFTIDQLKPQGVILSGGPSSVYASGAPTIDPAIFHLPIPILGICYGLQLIVHLLGGVVKRGRKKEFGPAILKIHDQSDLFLLSKNKLPSSFIVWMSHGDVVAKLPTDFCAIGRTKMTKYAVVENRKKKIYGLQFHPEVIHTQFGKEILENFLKIAGLSIKPRKIDTVFIDNLVADVKDSIVSEKAICALSGGVDSSVAAVLTHEAIGRQLQGIYIDSGLMRRGETAQLEQIFKKDYQVKVKVIRAQKIFLKNLKGISDPEKKRRMIGWTFIKVLEKEAKKIGARFLIQGTIYPDVIESAGSVHSSKIKSHHNVAGLPKNMKLVLVEPLRNLYKDEVRTIGKLLKLPDTIVYRQPFPGTGLAIRIIGEVTEKKLRLVRAVVYDITNKPPGTMEWE